MSEFENTMYQFDLDTIVAAKREFLAMRQQRMPTAALIALAEMQKRARHVLNVVTNGRHVTLIGQIRHEETYDPVAAALRLIRSGVDAVALFTDQRVYTQGLDDLLLVTQGIRNSPVIVQDYILNEYHVAEARAAGASAVVLYSSILEQPMLRRVVSVTLRWHMTAIVQVCDAEEMAYAARLSPHVIAVGSEQDFRRERDLPLMQELRPHLPYNTKFMPLGCLHTLEDVAAVIEQGADAVIVHESLTNRPQSLEKLRAMIDYRSEF